MMKGIFGNWLLAPLPGLIPALIDYQGFASLTPGYFLARLRRWVANDYFLVRLRRWVANDSFESIGMACSQLQIVQSRFAGGLASPLDTFRRGLEVDLHVGNHMLEAGFAGSSGISYLITNFQAGDALLRGAYKIQFGHLCNHISRRRPRFDPLFISISAIIAPAFRLNRSSQEISNRNRSRFKIRNLKSET